MLTLTDRQTAALAAMEASVGIRNHRTDFTDREAFQAYWDLIAQRCATQRRKRAAETPASRTELRAKQHANALRFYNKPANLVAYGKRYALRYQPSSAKLQAQLLKKCENTELCVTVMAELSSLLNDEIRALELAQGLQQRGRNVNHITQKLRLRLFAPEIIARCLRTIGDDNGSALDGDALRKNIQNLQRKGVSLASIRRRLTERPADAAVVAEAIANVGAQDRDDANLHAQIAKLRRRATDEQTLIRRLLGKGFPYAAIRSALRSPA